MEDYWMRKATERLFLPLIRLFLSEVVDIAMPAEGVLQPGAGEHQEAVPG